MPRTKPDVITSEEMAKIDQKVVEFGIPRLLLMENAGSAVARLVTEKFGMKLRAVIFAGTGNNGGDGFVTARHSVGSGTEIDIFLIGDPKDIRTEEALLNWDIIRRMKRNICIHVVKNPQALENARRCLKRADVIIDAMLGTGLKGLLREPFASAVHLINESDLPVVSIDAPTGLNPSTGEVHGISVKATHTVTFHKMKKGFLRRREYTGEIVVADIGIPPEIEAAASNQTIRSWRKSKRALVLVSACLLGVNCRYDGRNTLNERVARLSKKRTLVPVCPEQLGGLGTPREPMRIIGGEGSEVLDGKARVINRKGKDVTRHLVKGAEEVLKVVKSLGVKEAILKSRRPSCGYGKINDWTIPEGSHKGNGITAALLKKNGVRMITEENL